MRFETVSPQILKKGTLEVDVIARALPESVDQVDSVGTGDLRVMPRPIIGIERVFNHVEVFRSEEDESDSQEAGFRDHLAGNQGTDAVGGDRVEIRVEVLIASAGIEFGHGQHLVHLPVNDRLLVHAGDKVQQ